VIATLRAGIRRRIRNRVKSYREGKQLRASAALVRQLSDSKPTARKLMIDCGFNRGIVAEQMLTALPGFSLHGFEVQQDIRQFADRLRARLPDRQIEVMYAAVGKRDGAIDYFEAAEWGKNYKGGTTTVASKQSAVNYADPKQAPCVDFSRWLLSQTCDDAFVFVKMDIEGGEYEVIEHLLETGAIERIDVLAVEWHAHKFPDAVRTRYLAIEERVRQYAHGRGLTVIDWY